MTTYLAQTLIDQGYTVGTVQVLAQDETGGQQELKSLQDAGISAIDYGNGRYELSGGGYRQIATQTLEAESEGIRYTPVGAGIQIELSNGTPQIVIAQVSEAGANDSMWRIFA